MTYNPEEFRVGVEIEFVVPLKGQYKSSVDENEIFVLEKLAEFLKKKLSFPIHYAYESGYTKPINDYWQLVRDISIQSDDKFFVGAELTSPPISWDALKPQIQEIFDLINEQNWKTTGSTGLHINISFWDTSKNKKIDPLKLVLFSGIENLIKKFPRTNARNNRTRMTIDYIQSNLIHIKKSLRDEMLANRVSAKTLDDLILIVQKQLSSDIMGGLPRWLSKKQGINVGRLFSHGYIEFRVSGGQNYHTKFDQIEKLVEHYMKLMYIASTPDLYRKQYARKILNIIDAAIESNPVDDSSNTLTMEILKKLPTEVAKTAHDAIKQLEQGKSDWIFYFFEDHWDLISNKVIIRANFVKILKNLGIDKSKFGQYYNDYINSRSDYSDDEYVPKVTFDQIAKYLVL